MYRQMQTRKGECPLNSIKRSPIEALPLGLQAASPTFLLYFLQSEQPISLDSLAKRCGPV